jgi:hypothetical protein
MDISAEITIRSIKSMGSTGQPPLSNLSGLTQFKVDNIIDSKKPQ